MKLLSMSYLAAQPIEVPQHHIIVRQQVGPHQRVPLLHRHAVPIPNPAVMTGRTTHQEKGKGEEGRRPEKGGQAETEHVRVKKGVSSIRSGRGMDRGRNWTVRPCDVVMTYQAWPIAQV